MKYEGMSETRKHGQHSGGNERVEPYGTVEHDGMEGKIDHSGSSALYHRHHSKHHQDSHEMPSGGRYMHPHKIK